MFKVAIVEDQKSDVDVLREFLNRYGKEHGISFQIDVFYDGASFISDYNATYSIIFMDIEMPHMDGLTAARRLREVDESVCLIFVTNMARYAIRGYEVSAHHQCVPPRKRVNASRNSFL